MIVCGAGPRLVFMMSLLLAGCILALAFVLTPGSIRQAPAATPTSVLPTATPAPTSTLMPIITIGPVLPTKVRTR